jgi:hypothetical protein
MVSGRGQGAVIITPCLMERQKAAGYANWLITPYSWLLLTLPNRSNGSPLL